MIWKFARFNAPILFIAAYQVLAASIHVQSGGSIQNAVNGASAGDTIIVHAGTYNGGVVMKAGAIGKPIVLRNNGNDKVTISGGQLTAASNNHYEGITISNSNAFGIRGLEVSNVVVKNCVTSTTVEGGICFVRTNYRSTADGGANITIDGCEVTRAHNGGGNHESISLEGINGFEVKNCHVYNCRKEGIDAKYNARNGTIHHNYVHNCGAVLIYCDAGNNIKIYNNKMHDTGPHGGIQLGIESAYNPNHWDSHDVAVYNNIIYRGVPRGIEWFVETTGAWSKFRNFTVYNNIVYNCSDAGICLTTPKGPGVMGRNIVIRNNIVWKNTNASIRIHSLDMDSCTIDHNLFDRSPVGANAIITSDVRWANESVFDFHLRSGSPAIDAGTSAGAPQFDLDDRPRPQGKGIDIGPYEFGSATGLRSLVPIGSALPGGRVRLLSIAQRSPHIGQPFVLLNGRFGFPQEGRHFSALAISR